MHDDDMTPDEFDARLDAGEHVTSIVVSGLTLLPNRATTASAAGATEEADDA